MEYLSFKWSERSVHNFNKKAFKVIEMISHHPNIYKLSEFKSIHTAVITKQTSLFYALEDSKIFLITFWDNRQNPAKLKYKTLVKFNKQK